MGKPKLLTSIMVGLFFSVLWLMLGIPMYINSLAAHFGMKYLICFVWAIPLLSVVFVAIFKKNFGYMASTIYFFIGTIFLSLIAPGYF
ncbi:hypothetical protein ACFPES_21540 [Paenibacillus sp. GCM10023248]|uniref:hypothetical protein n=1 Tax=unclassified Paenibacillus TaxID=185978 RepID=UPI002378A0A9|nr:hypothetical protein [Paenibacillus sp. MAHUQ-63]MDD9269642.1 hypothetical protein [Paenibacillus sp. MAHUQ-63]